MYSLFLFFLTALYAYGATLEPIPHKNTLVIYNGNLALVHEEKKLSISSQEKQIIYNDVAPSIITNSINIRLPEALTLYWQEYRYDKLTLKKLLDYYVGKIVRINNTQHATLLSHQGETALIQLKEGTIMSVPTKTITFDTLPQTLITKPSLLWNIHVKHNTQATMTLEYLLRNIHWHSDYLLMLHKNSADLTGWVTITNKSGKAFTNTQLTLVAGDVHMINAIKSPMSYLKSTMQSAKSPVISQKAYEGYYIYNVPFAVNLQNNQNSQIQFLSKKKLPIKRSYQAYLHNPLYLRGELQTHFYQYVHFTLPNTPLAEGDIRSYSTIQNTHLLLGENHLSHTAKNTPIKLKLGKNFDLKVTQTLLSRTQNKKYIASSIHYSVANNSETPKKITLLIPFTKDKNAKIQTAKPFTFTQGHLVTFNLDIQANTTLSFEVHFQGNK